MIRPEYQLQLEDIFASRTDLPGRIAYAGLRPLAALFPSSRRLPSAWDSIQKGSDITLTGKHNTSGHSSTIRIDLMEGIVHRVDVRTGPAKRILPPRLLIAWWQNAKGPAITADTVVREERRMHSKSSDSADTRLTLSLETSHAFVTPESNAHSLMLRGVSEAHVLEQLGITYPVRIRPIRIRFDGSQRHETDNPVPHESVERVYGEPVMPAYTNIRRDPLRWYAEVFGLKRTTGKNLLGAWYAQFRNTTWTWAVQPPVSCAKVQ